MALFRALESARPASRRLFADPLARRFLRPSLALIARASALPGVGAATSRYIDRRWPGARTSAVAPTRLLDDHVVESVARGVEQVVILGAGFDCRAQRLPALREVTVFEVDHPATQRRKLRALEGLGSGLAGKVRFVATDFDRQELEPAIRAAGYRDSSPTLFLWEGVTNYLSEEAVDATLRWCSRAAPGSRLVFSYVDRAVLDDPRSFFGAERLFATLEAVGERWTFGIDPALACEFVGERGLVLERDLGAAEYRRLCFGEAARGMRGYEFYRIAVARVLSVESERAGEGSRSPSRLEKVVSGGQTGADRAALDVALELGLRVGGFVPRGRRAEDGPIPDRYPGLVETESADPRLRTVRNVRDSDATLVVSHGPPGGGSRLALEEAGRCGKPRLHLDLEALSHAAAAARLREWLLAVGPRVLNVAGPRASEDPAIAAATAALLRAALPARGELRE